MIVGGHATQYIGNSHSAQRVLNIAPFEIMNNSPLTFQRAPVFPRFLYQYRRTLTGSIKFESKNQSCFFIFANCQPPYCPIFEVKLGMPLDFPKNQYNLSHLEGHRPGPPDFPNLFFIRSFLPSCCC